MSSKPTIWKVPPFLKPVAKVLLDHFYPPQTKGRPRADLILVIDGCLYRLRTGCQWRAMPREFGPATTVHGWFQRFCSDGFFLALWRAVLDIALALNIVYLAWLSLDGFLIRARARGRDAIGPNPTDRAKPGTKRSVLTDELGGPIATVVAGANVHDSKLFDLTLAASLLRLRHGRFRRTSHICLDKGYDSAAVRRSATAVGLIPHVRRIGEEHKHLRGHPLKKARRWVVERAGAWYNQCRGLATRFDVKGTNYLGLCQLRNALIWWSRIQDSCGF